MKSFILASIVVLSLIGVIGMQESFATQCAPGIIRIDDVKRSSQYVEIGKDILHISGNLTNLSGKPQDVLITISSNDGGWTCGGPIFFYPNFANEGTHFERISGTSENISLQPSETQYFEMDLKPLKSGSYVVRTAAITDKYMNLDGGWTIIIKEIPPLKQIASGVEPKQVICNQKLQLVLKDSNNFSACVTENSAKKLINRGWTLHEQQKPMPIIYDFPDQSNFFNFTMSNYPKLDETATVTITSLNPYSFDLTPEHNEYLRIDLHGFEFVNVPQDKILTDNDHTFSIQEPLLASPNQTQSFTAEIRPTSEHEHRINAYGVGKTYDFLHLFIDESQSVLYDERPVMEVTDEEFEKILQQRMKVQEEMAQCNKTVENNWNSTEHTKHSKLVNDAHLCQHDVRDRAIYEGINMTDCITAPSNETLDNLPSHNETEQITLEEALELQRIRLETSQLSCPP